MGLGLGARHCHLCWGCEQSPFHLHKQQNLTHSMVGKAWKWRCVWQMETDPHTRVPGTQMALAPASWALIALIQMSSLVETQPVRWHELPGSAAGPGLGLLSLCLGYHHHATSLKQGTSLLSLGCSGLRTLPKPHEEPSLLLSQTPEARWFLAGAWLHKGTSAPPPSPSACSSSDTSCSFLQRHVISLTALSNPTAPWPNWGLHYYLLDPVLCLILPMLLLVPTGQARALVTPASRFIQVSVAVQTRGLKH